MNKCVNCIFADLSGKPTLTSLFGRIQSRSKLNTINGEEVLADEEEECNIRRSKQDHRLFKLIVGKSVPSVSLPGLSLVYTECVIS